jgi:cytochrome c biogenesis protein CcdA
LEGPTVTTTDDTDIDSFELELRRKDARRSILVGGALVIVGIALFVVGLGALLLAVLTTTGTIRFPLVIFVAAVGLSGMGFRSVSQGFRKRKDAQIYEVELRLQPSTSRSA